MTINDDRLGYVGQTPGRSNSGLGQLPTGEWNVVVGVWNEDGSCQTWLNGVAGNSRTCSNGSGNDENEVNIGR